MQEENPGGFVAVGGLRKHITLDVEPKSELLSYGHGEVRLMITNGADKAKIYPSATGGTGVSEVSWLLPDDAEDIEYYLTNGVYLGGISASTSLTDVQVDLYFLDPYYGDPVFDDWVNLTVVRVDHVTVTGATQTNVTGDHNWAAVKNASGNVTVEAILNPTIPDAHVPDVLVWTGGNAVPDHPRQRTVPKATSAETTVTATVGSSSDYANIWILWASVEIKMDGNTPPNAVQYGSSWDGTEHLGAITFNGGAVGVGKVVPVGTITPAGVHSVVASGWNFMRDKWVHDFRNGSKITDEWNSGWTLDYSYPEYQRLTPDSNDMIYDRDEPDVANWGHDSEEKYGNLRQWVEWNSTVASDDAFWYYRGRWKSNRSPQVTLNEVGSGSIELPAEDQAFYGPP